MQEVTDPKLLDLLNANDTPQTKTTQKKREVTDPELLNSLNQNDGAFKSFAKGFTQNFDEYASSINKGLDKVADFATGKDTKFFEDNQAYWNRQREMNELETSEHPYSKMAGQMILDPINLTPAGIVSKGQKLGKIGTMLTKTKPRAIATSMAGGAAIGAGTMAVKNYGNDDMTQEQKSDDMLMGAGIVSVINGIISGVTKGRVTNAIKDIPTDATNSPDEIANAIMGNPKEFGLTPDEASTVVNETKSAYPKVPDEFKIEQAGAEKKPQDPNFIQVPKYPPMSQEQALDVLAREADKKRLEQGLEPIYSINRQVQPEFKTESIYSQQPKTPSTPTQNFVSGDFNNNMPTPYSEVGNIEARYQSVAAHPRLQELLEMRESVLAKDAKSPTRNTDNGYFAHENLGKGFETTKVRPNTEKNYNADFQLTKQDIYKLYTGKVDEDLLYKLETDLGTLDNHPDYAPQSNKTEIDYSQHQDPQYADKPKEMSDDDWNTANAVFSKGIDNVAVGTYAGVEQDENGNITFDPGKFVLGLGGYTAVKAALKNKTVQGKLKEYAQDAINKIDMNPAVYKENGFNAMSSGNNGLEVTNIKDIPWDKLSKKEASKIVRILHAIPNNKGVFKNNTIIKTNEGDVKVTDLFAKKEIDRHLDNPNLRGMVTTEEVASFPKVSKNIEATKNYQGDTWNAKTNDNKDIVYGSKKWDDESNLVTTHTKTEKGERGLNTSNVSSSNINDTVSIKPSNETIIPQESQNIKANGMHSMAGGFAGGADSLINQRDYNQDGEYDYKDLLAGVAAGTISISALKKAAPKLFDDGSKGGVKAGLFAGSKAKGFDVKAQAGKTFDGKYDGMERFEIDDSKATVDFKKLDDMIKNDYELPLHHILKHKEFYENYPQLQGAKIKLVAGDGSYFDAKSGEIGISANKLLDDKIDGTEKVKSALLHEIQHAIQKQEGFARGGSAQEFYNDAKNKINLLRYELEFEPDEFIQDKMMAKLQKLEETYQNKGKEEAFDMYQKLAGEIEARDVQARMDYTPKQREEIAPYSSESVTPEDAVMKFDNSNDDIVNGLKQMSETKPEKTFKDKVKEAKSKGYEHIVNLVDKETRKEWGDATSTLRRLFTDTLGADYHKIREDATASTNGMSVKLERLHNVLKELDETDRVSMHNYIVGEESNIPDTLKPLADNIKKNIDDLSKQLVDLEVLTKEQYDEWAGHYIHRNYEKHFFKDIKGLMKKGFKIDEIHKRGKIDEIGPREAKRLLLDPAFIASTTKNMRDGGQRLRKLPNGKYELRRDWTKAEREAMNEITDISISAPETLMRLKRMVDNANFMKNINDIDNVILKNADEFNAEEISAQGFAKVPNSPKYGVLAGKTIRKDVLDDLSARNDELFNTFHGSDGALGRVWKNYLSVWKKSKTVWNAPSHVNNFMSNTFLMHLSGMRADEVVTAVGRAGKMMVKGNKYENLLKKQMLGKATKKELSELAEMGDDLKYFVEAKEGGLLGRSQLNDILQGSQDQVRTTALGKLDKFTEDAYHNGDAINRIAMYSHLRSKLDMSADEARKAVLTIMPDYSKPMPKGYRILRDTGVSPFISWSYYTMPAVVKMLGTKQGAKKATLAMGTLAGLEYALTGGDVTPMDNIPFIDTNKPEDFKGRRFGVSSKGGEVTTVKTDRWIPYVELLNPINFLVSNVSGVSTNAVVNAVTSNSAAGMINPYYGRPITYKNKKTGDKAYDYAKYLAKSYVPLPAQAYSGWDLVDSLARSKSKRTTNKVTVPRSNEQNLLKQIGLNSLSYSKRGLKKEQKE